MTMLMVEEGKEEVCTSTTIVVDESPSTTPVEATMVVPPTTTSTKGAAAVVSTPFWIQMLNRTKILSKCYKSLSKGSGGSANVVSVTHDAVMDVMEEIRCQIKCCEEVLGDRHPITAMLLNEMGCIQTEVCDYTNAFSSFGEALDILMSDRVLDVSVGGDLRWTDQCHYDEDDLDESLDLFFDAKKIIVNNIMTLMSKIRSHIVSEYLLRMKRNLRQQQPSSPSSSPLVTASSSYKGTTSSSSPSTEEECDADSITVLIAEEDGEGESDILYDNDMMDDRDDEVVMHSSCFGEQEDSNTNIVDDGSKQGDDASTTITTGAGDDRLVKEDVFLVHIGGGTSTISSNGGGGTTNIGLVKVVRRRNPIKGRCLCGGGEDIFLLINPLDLFPPGTKGTVIRMVLEQLIQSNPEDVVMDMDYRDNLEQ